MSIVGPSPWKTRVRARRVQRISCRSCTRFVSRASSTDIWLSEAGSISVLLRGEWHEHTRVARMTEPGLTRPGPCSCHRHIAHRAGIGQPRRKFGDLDYGDGEDQ